MKVSQLMDYMKDRARYEEVLRALDVESVLLEANDLLLGFLLLERESTAERRS